MTKSSSPRTRWIALAILAPLCALLVYRNLIAPGEQKAAASLPRLEPVGADGLAQNRTEARPRPASPAETRKGEGRLGPQELAALDPTLRVDLLEKSRQVKYEGGSRNIFQYYTPPPPALTPAAPAAPAAPPPGSPPPPLPPAIPLKFYGIAVPPGSAQKKAFLTDGEEIFIAQEGETVAKFYKVLRIGVSNIELEDSRSKQRANLVLQEE